MPRTVDELQAGVPILAQEGATFGVRSGGHMPVAGAAMADHGVLIDMSRFANIDYDKEKNQVVVGTGLRWKDVYGYLDPYEVTVVGGRVLDVGVGGLILGCECRIPVDRMYDGSQNANHVQGGLSYLSESYGLACDNVVNFQVGLVPISLCANNASMI